jgi:L-lactate dehydrogenase (cytochrome)
MKDRGFARSLIERAAAAKCSALMLTIDLQVLGQRHCDVRNGLSVPPEIKILNVLDIMTRPSWAFGMLAAKRKTFGNLAGYARSDGTDVKSLSSWIATQFDPTLSWKDVEWIRSLWPGKLILKGVLDADDARLAAKTGASALVVSNHGGRQLDGAPSSISVLPKIVDTVGGEFEVMFDGGIRSGQDIMRALALGARSCLIGRAYIYGLGALGERGVARAIHVLRKELEVTMALCGINTVREIGRQVIA